MTKPESLTNVDLGEIAKFEALASRWWDPESEFKPLHDINPLRANWIDKHAAVAGKRVADIGCGGGLLSEALAQRGAEVTGIDMGEAPLAVARLHQLESGLQINYRQMTAEQLAKEAPNSFDIVTCTAAVIKACAALVKPGGQVFFSTLNRNPKSYLFAIIGAEYLMRMLPRGTHEYSKFIKPSEMGQWIREADLNLAELMGMTYNPLTRHYKLIPNDVQVNYLMRCTKPE